MVISATKVSGRSLIGFGDGAGASATLHGFNPATSEEVDRAVRLAAQAFDAFRNTTGKQRGALLRRIAENIEAIAEEVIERAALETALPKARPQGETARTCGQLRLFAQLAEEGSWVNARIDLADPNRKPLPKPDIRSMLR